MASKSEIQRYTGRNNAPLSTPNFSKTPGYEVTGGGTIGKPIKPKAVTLKQRSVPSPRVVDAPGVGTI